MKKTKVSELQTYLTVLFVAALLISNVITAKQIQLPFGITLTGGVYIFPITYILSDLFSEVYGYRWSRITCYLAFGANLLMVGFFELAIISPAPVWFENQDAFKAVLSSTPRVLAGSLAAFVVGDFANDKIFKKMKEKHPNDHKGFGFRAILSSLVGELVDSVIFFPIAFLGAMPISALLGTIAIQTVIKTAYEVIILPVTRLAVGAVSKAEDE